MKASSAAAVGAMLLLALSFWGATSLRFLSQRNARTGARLGSESLVSDSRLLRHDGSIPTGYVAICSVQRNSHRDIREWIEYHLWIGVSTIYLYDDGSNASLLPLVADYVRDGRVIFADIPATLSIWHSSHALWGSLPREGRYKDTPQLWGFDHCLSPDVRSRHTWIAMIDGDEFIVLREHGDEDLHFLSHPRPAPNLTAHLHTLERCSSIILNWKVFGTSGHKTPPAQGVLAGFTACAPPAADKSRATKTIANTAWTTQMLNAHQAVHARASPPSCRGDGSLSTGIGEGYQTTTAQHFPLLLFHYVSKSETNVKRKMEQGGGQKNRKSRAYFQHIEDIATERCTVGQVYARNCCPSLPSYRQPL